MDYQFAIWTAIASFLVVAPWIYTLTKENKRLRGKYRICSEERQRLDALLTQAVNDLNKNRAEFLERGNELYKYEHLAVTEAPKLGKTGVEPAWETMQWIVAHAGKLKAANLELKEKREFDEHQLDELGTKLNGALSDLETAKNLANCYLLSRNQARDDIEGIKRNAVRSVGVIKFEDGSWNDVGQALFSDIGKDLSAGEIIPSPKRRPRKAASGS
jgi:hypothetical protein